MGHIQITTPGGADEATYTCPSGVAVRDAVYISAANTVDSARANSASTLPVVGVVVSKPTSTTAVVRMSGEVDGFSALTPNATYFLSASVAGAITATAPTTHGTDYQQVVGVARDADTLVLEIDRDVIEM